MTSDPLSMTTGEALLDALIDALYAAQLAADLLLVTLPQQTDAAVMEAVDDIAASVAHRVRETRAALAASPTPSRGRCQKGGIR